MKTLAAILIALTLALAGCSNSGPRNFKLIFTMESVNSYKLSITVEKDGKYLIQQQNLFFDSHANKEHINTAKGEMTADELARLRQLLGNYIFKMQDSYGFDSNRDNNPLDGLFYYLDYTQGSRNKTVSINPTLDEEYPQPFPELVSFLSAFSSGHLK